MKTGLIKILKNEFGLAFEYLSPEKEEEMDEYALFKEKFEELLKCDLMKNMLLKIFDKSTEKAA
jgi:hypothetical protein